MAVYRIYPEADAFITSFKSESNAGIDEIVELAGFPNQTIKGESSRILVKFKSTEVESTLDNIVASSFSASINYTIAEASELPSSPIAPLKANTSIKVLISSFGTLFPSRLKISPVPQWLLSGL